MSSRLEPRAMRWMLFLPPLAQFGAVTLWSTGWPPSTRLGMDAQLAALFIMVVVYGAFGIQRFRFLRHSYRDIKRRRVEQARAFKLFVDAHLPRR